MSSFASLFYLFHLLLARPLAGADKQASESAPEAPRAIVCWPVKAPEHLVGQQASKRASE